MERNGVDRVGSHSDLSGTKVALDAPSLPVGSFRYGGVFNRRPRVFGTWLVTSSDASILGRVAELLGGTLPNSHEPDHDPYVITDAVEVDILLRGPADLDVGWCRQPAHVCDSGVQHDQHRSRPRECPPDPDDRRIAARAGQGCRPRVRVCFRLLQDPELGAFAFSSGNWTFAQQASRDLGQVRCILRPVRARLGIQRAPHRLRSGTTIVHTWPVLDLLGPAT
jgi:hypothetical protein